MVLPSNTLSISGTSSVADYPPAALDQPLTILEQVLGKSLRPVDESARYWITPEGKQALREDELGGVA